VNPILVIAGLSIREAVRRKIVAAFVVITIGLVGLSAWGFDRLSNTQSITSGEVRVAIPQALILFMFMFSFVVALSASAMASPAVSSDAESGVLQSIVTRPIRRSHILFGKWLGLCAVVFAYAGVVTVLEVAVVDWVSGFVPPDPVAVGLYLFGEGAMLLTLALLLSTRLSAIAAGVVGIALFGAAWLAGVVGSLGAAFNISALRTVGQFGRYIVPTDGLWHGAIYYLEPQSFVAQRIAEASDATGNPFFAQSPPTWAYLVWVAIWFVAVMTLGLLSFEHREL
jgi:ABC-type transport system involved in multi-copper enzyme maturation permease subunit